MTVAGSPAASHPFFSRSFSVFLSCCLLHLCTSLHYHCLPTNTLTKRHTHTCTWWAQNTVSFSCLGKDTVKLTHPELSCHLCHLRLVCVCAFVCVFMLCVLASPWAGSALWEVTVNMHKLGCTGRGTGLWFDHHRRHRENMTNTAALHARESPLRFWRAPSAPARASTQTLECFHCMRTDWVTNEINCKKMIKYSYFSWQ